MRAVRRLVTVAAGALLAAPLLLAGPAYADTATPIASEPPGGATCLPGTEATCGQDTGVSPSPTGTPSPTSTASPTPSATPSPTAASASPQVAVTTIPVTGSRQTLARTGAGPAAAWGYAGAGLLAAGGLLVLAGRRPRRAR